jgi:ribosome recycling factor
MSDLYSSTEAKMAKAINALTQEFTKLRAGRAHPSLLDHVMVSSYGTDVPLNQVGNVVAEDARTLMVNLWDKTQVAAVEKAIMQADLGLNPMSAGTVIRIPMPPLTEERRRELVKIVRDTAESSKVAVRNARRDANSTLKSDLKDKKISEDEDRDGQDKIQKITDKFIKEIDSMVKKKEQDLMSV